MLGCKKLPRDLQSGDDDRLGGEIQTNGEDGAGDTDWLVRVPNPLSSFKSVGEPVYTRYMFMRTIFWIIASIFSDVEVYLHTLEITERQIFQMNTTCWKDKRWEINLFAALNQACRVDCWLWRDVLSVSSGSGKYKLAEAQTLLQMDLSFIATSQSGSANGPEAFQSLKASVVAL